MKSTFTTVAAIAALAGCTFEDGKGFATLDSASLSARFEPGAARDLGNGIVLTSQGYRVALTRASLGVEALALNELREGSAPNGTFDPAHPPPGYSLCHGGHCHADDGRLVDYADIEAELAGGGARFEPVARVPASRAFDFLAGQTAVLDAVEPSRELPQARITQLSLSIERLELEGSVTGGPEGGGLGQSSAALVVELPIGSSIDAGMSLAIDRDEPGAFSLRAALAIDGTLFDDIDFAPLQNASRIEIVDLESEPAVALASSLLKSQITITIH
jgi:hypothetical protein